MNFLSVIVQGNATFNYVSASDRTVGDGDLMTSTI